MLHIHCGDSSAAQLRLSGVPGEVMVWCDLLHEGPLPADGSGDEWRRVRAGFLSASTRGALAAEGSLRWLTDQDARLERFREHDEVVLWFDACLYDQTILIRQLDWFSRQPRGGTRLSLICIAAFLSMPRFKGLGELDPQQLASLLPQRHAVTPAEFALATEAWAAFRAPDPRRVQALLERNTSALPYLGDALIRHLEQFPSVRNGLDRLSQEALGVIAAGADKLGDIFTRVSDLEARPYFGDTTLWNCLDQLALAPVPLLEVTGPGPLPLWEPPRDLSPWTVHITPAGRDVMDGKRNWLECREIDAWRGGVHLRPDNLWLWDGEKRRLIHTSPREGAVLAPPRTPPERG